MGRSRKRWAPWSAASLCEADGEQGGKVRQTHAISALYAATWFEGPLRGASGLIHFTLKKADRLEARRTIAFAYHRPRNLSRRRLGEGGSEARSTSPALPTSPHLPL
jgi:hypothetical protein